MGATPPPSTLDLESALDTAASQPSRGGCALGLWISTLEEGPAKDKLRVQLATHPRIGISNPKMSAIVSRFAGYEISTFVVSNHRRSICKCKEVGLV